jgi:integrase
MAVYKDGDKWRAVYRYTSFTGERKQTQKRGFATKREALAWEREKMLKNESKLDMTFASFVEIFEVDRKKRIKENTWETKRHIIRAKILPYFGERKIGEIEPKDVIAWQNELLAYKDENGRGYAAGYLKTIHAQLSAIFNHAVRFYHLPYNPAARAGSMGGEDHKEMLFWTKEEYLKFADVMMDKPVSYYAFEVLYWTGVRSGELLALTPADFNFDRQELTINKSYQRLKRRDVITSPKTPKSNRTIKLPKFLCEEIQEYIGMHYEIGENERLFPISKSYLHHEMDRGAKEAGVKRIRIHDLRHSAVSLLIEMGFPALAIAERMGHESIDITYRYAHLFPTRQTEMAEKLDFERMGKEEQANGEKA